MVSFFKKGKWIVYKLLIHIHEVNNPGMISALNPHLEII